MTDKKRQRLQAAIHDQTQDDVPEVAPRVVLKSKQKKHSKKCSRDDDDTDIVPMVKMKKTKTKKEKKKKKVEVESDTQVASTETTVIKGPTIVKTPGMPDGKSLKKEKKLKKSKKQKREHKSASTIDGKSMQRQTVAVNGSQSNSLLTYDTQDDTGVSLLDQALASVVTKTAGDQATKPSRKKQKTVMDKENIPLKHETKERKSVQVGEKKDAGDGNSGNEVPKVLSKSLKKKMKKKVKSEKHPNLEKADNNSFVSDTCKAAANVPEEGTSSAVDENVGVTSSVQSVKTVQPTPPSPSSSKKRKKLSKGNSVLPSAEATVKPKKAKIASEPSAPIPTETVLNKEKKTKDVASLTKDTQKKEAMLLSFDKGSPRGSQVIEDVSFETKRDLEDITYMPLFSRLIDSAARERWELGEVGRLVRLFAAEWDFETNLTAQFLLETCPELVCVEFLEGLSVNLTAKQLVEIFEAGSGNSGVLMNKMASAVENGDLRVDDSDFVSALTRRVELMESNAEVYELLYPILESLSKVRDVGALLKLLCEHWQLERKTALVQQVLLSNVFDDLDGDQDEILLDLPDLTGRLDFPSRLDQEDVDENGNLKDFLVDDDSGDEVYKVQVDDSDSDDDDEGETDAEHENEDSGESRGRNPFIEDEADVGDDDEDEDGERNSEEESSSSDSE